MDVNIHIYLFFYGKENIFFKGIISVNNKYYIFHILYFYNNQKIKSYIVIKKNLIQIRINKTKLN